ncbi:predicted protein [Uncinocarpus reesii 1704]|uniref:Uncharacterized protein n=1 Tax=Uncinocarpus reesii (strain UAMH 1704) TaxID=336963 RepID=C4JT28_UNCRE|nr:uncharacterized protein UREG_05617 [Uncinocarpus reesii 1704]EEP80775.1 predicted protein [Uncinocarpus reesii 1704]
MDISSPERASGSPFLSESTRVASEIILLFDSEHLTACNWRKRRLFALKDSWSPDHFAQSLGEEFSFTTTLLRSPLHRHAKSPTLWYHRYWVMTEALRLDTRHMQSVLLAPHATPSEQANMDDLRISEALLQGQLAVGLKAGEQHPMNYYAFNYLREVFALLECRFKGDSKMPSRAESSVEGFKALARAQLEGVHRWCLGHPRDISGWTFLVYLLEMMDDALVQTATVEKTVEYALTVGWEEEALWTFVTLSLSRFGIDSETISSADYNITEQGGCRFVQPTKTSSRWANIAAMAKTRSNKDRGERPS